MPPIKNPKSKIKNPLSQQPSDTPLYLGDRVDLVLRPVTTTTGKTITREVCLHRGAVIILPILQKSPLQIVMIQNRRHTVHQTLLELPAGTLEYRHPRRAQKGGGRPGDPTEKPAACAARELTEETGYIAQKITPLGWFYTSPGILTEKMFAFLATGLTPGPQSLEDNEQIRPLTLSKPQILSLIRENRIIDAKSIATLLKYLAGT